MSPLLFPHPLRNATALNAISEDDCYHINILAKRLPAENTLNLLYELQVCTDTCPSFAGSLFKSWWDHILLG